MVVKLCNLCLISIHPPGNQEPIVLAVVSQPCHMLRHIHNHHWPAVSFRLGSFPVTQNNFFLLLCSSVISWQDYSILRWLNISHTQFVYSSTSESCSTLVPMWVSEEHRDFYQLCNQQLPTADGTADRLRTDCWGSWTTNWLPMSYAPIITSLLIVYRHCITIIFIVSWRTVTVFKIYLCTVTRTQKLWVWTPNYKFHSIFYVSQYISVQCKICNAGYESVPG